MTNVPDEFSIEHDEKIISYRNERMWAYHFFKHEIIPEQALRVEFRWHPYGEFLNTNYLNIYGDLYLTKKIYGVLYRTYLRVFPDE